MNHKYITAQNKLVGKSLMLNDCPTATKMCLSSSNLWLPLPVGLPNRGPFLFAIFLKVLRILSVSL